MLHLELIVGGTSGGIEVFGAVKVNMIDAGVGGGEERAEAQDGEGYGDEVP